MRICEQDTRGNIQALVSLACPPRVRNRVSLWYTVKEPLRWKPLVTDWDTLAHSCEVSAEGVSPGKRGSSA